MGGSPSLPLTVRALHCNTALIKCQGVFVEVTEAAFDRQSAEGFGVQRLDNQVRSWWQSWTALITHWRPPCCCYLAPTVPALWSGCVCRRWGLSTGTTGIWWLGWGGAARRYRRIFRVAPTYHVPESNLYFTVSTQENLWSEGKTDSDEGSGWRSENRIQIIIFFPSAAL